MSYRDEKGFTLTEFFLAITIMLFIIGAAVSLYLLSYTTWQETSVLASLEREGGIALNKMIRGVVGIAETRRNGIREAKSFTIPNASTIQFTSGVDNQARRFYLDQGQIIYNGLGGETAVAKGVNSLIFTQIANKRVRVNLSLQKQVKDKTIDMSLESEVIVRNR